VATVDRPDGSQQVTLDGAPLYTFTQEGPGEVTGDGASDSFGGEDFTWHAVTPSGSASTAPPSTTTSSGSSPGGYSY
jgi:hypothetical protein